MGELVGPTKRSDIADRDGVRRSLKRAGGLQYRAEGLGMRDELSARRFDWRMVTMALARVARIRVTIVASEVSAT